MYHLSVRVYYLAKRTLIFNLLNHQVKILRRLPVDLRQASQVLIQVQDLLVFLLVYHLQPIPVPDHPLCQAHQQVIYLHLAQAICLLHLLLKVLVDFRQASPVLIQVQDLLPVQVSCLPFVPVPHHPSLQVTALLNHLPQVLRMDLL